MTDQKKEAAAEPGYSESYAATEESYRENESGTGEGSEQTPDYIEIEERKLIREGWLTWRAEDLGQTTDRVKALASRHKGYFSVENQYNYSSRAVQNLTLRIPSDKFDSFVEELSAGIEHFERRNINVVDVTAEFIDVEARIKSKKEMESRYIALLQQARTVTEMLEIERNLGNLRQDIESAQARLNGISDRVAYSTLYLEFYVPVEEHQYTEDEPGFWSRSTDAIAEGWNRVLNFFVRVMLMWPFLLIMVISIFLLRKRIKKMLQRIRQ